MGNSESGGLSPEEGKQLIGLARKAISYFHATGNIYASQPPGEKFREKRGAFVTLKNAEGTLRGCIGLPYPVRELWFATTEAAVSAAFNDPRFKAVKAKEMDSVLVEISVLSKPEEVEKGKLAESIEVGKHGLIVEKGYRSGLLLPQVAVEYSWDLEEFLKQTCMKAGLAPNAWKAKETIVKRFSAQVFSEKEPNGEVLES